MKPILAMLAFLSLALSSFSQTVEENYPKTLWCPNDTFLLKYGDDPGLDTFKVSRKDKGSPGFDASPGTYAVIYYAKDSLRLNYHNRLPYQHNYYVNFESPKGKTTLRFHFNELAGYFPSEYIDKHTGDIQFDIPEVYELANIIWTLSPSGNRGKDLYKDGAYYDKVVAWFKPYLDHPIFKALDFPDSLYAQRYYEFRENSFAFNFQESKPGSKNTKLLFNGPYYYVYGSELADSSLFGKLKPLVEDFAAKSKFRQFYKNNLDYYAAQLKRQKELLPIRSMWTWLEDQFPRRKFQSYRIVSSPLILGSHSTQQYHTYKKTAWFSESVMFICGTDRYDKQADRSEKQKQGLMSGIVFTEIDHNYVNPTTGRYAKQVDSIFSNRGVWTKKGASSDFYGSGVSVFNEYMTHAAFCLWVWDSYDKETADFVVDQREDLMINRRGFIRFKEFNRGLLKLRQEHKELKLVDLYPYIIEWSRKAL